MKTKILVDKGEIHFFTQEYNRLSRELRYTASQVERLKIRAFFDSNRTMIAGYAINNKHPYKTLSYIPDDVMLDGVRIKQSKKTNFAEVIVLWIDSKASNSMRAFIYSMAIIDCVLLKPDYILGGCSLSGVWRTQRRVFPNILWQGEGRPFGKTVYNWVYYARPTKALFRLPYAVIMGWIDRSKRINRMTRLFRGRAKSVNKLNK